MGCWSDDDAIDTLLELDDDGGWSSAHVSGDEEDGREGDEQDERHDRGQGERGDGDGGPCREPAPEPDPDRSSSSDLIIFPAVAEHIAAIWSAPIEAN